MANPHKTMIDRQPHIWLQNTGYVPAIPAGTVKPGMRISWNYGYSNEVVEVYEHGREVTIVLKMSGTMKPYNYPIRKKPGTLVAAYWPSERQKTVSNA